MAAFNGDRDIFHHFEKYNSQTAKKHFNHSNECSSAVLSTIV